MSQKPQIAVGLIHWPIKDKAGNTVCTNVTNLDVHDIARACRVYGVDRYYIINPMKEQLIFVSRMLEFWRSERGAGYNPMRRTALTMVHTAHSLEEAKQDWGGDIELITTSARAIEGSPGLGFKELKDEMLSGDVKKYFLLFGTGFGLESSVYQGTRVLEPIKSLYEEEYRHLSVRSAVSICLDRLLGAW